MAIDLRYHTVTCDADVDIAMKAVALLLDEVYTFLDIDGPLQPNKQKRLLGVAYAVVVDIQRERHTANSGGAT